MLNIFKKNLVTEKESQSMMIHLKELSHQALENEAKLKLDCQAMILLPMCVFAAASLFFMGRENTLLQFIMFFMVFGSLVFTNKWSDKKYHTQALKNTPFFKVKSILEDPHQQLVLLHEVEKQQNKLGKENTDNINYQLKKLFLKINQDQLMLKDLSILNEIIQSYQSIENNQEELNRISQEYERYMNKNHFNEKEMNALQKRL